MEYISRTVISSDQIAIINIITANEMGYVTSGYMRLLSRISTLQLIAWKRLVSL